MYGGSVEVVARDRQTLPPSTRYFADTVHIPHHATNNNTKTRGGSGLMPVLNVAGWSA